jgi:hypothetical protein
VKTSDTKPDPREEAELRRTYWFAGAVLAGVATCLAVACQKRDTTTVATLAAAPAYSSDATIKDLMVAIVDPSADVVWDAVTTTVVDSGIEEKRPKSDEEWATIRQGAIRLVEASNLLMMPGRHMARPGERSETPGIELEPEEMEALVSKDRQGWNERAGKLHEMSLEVLKAIDNHDAEKLFEVGDDLDTACENCHRQYWYPNEKIPAFPDDPVSSSGK